MLRQMSKSEFDCVYDIMQKSFPKEEYRPYEAQKKLLDRSEYEIYVNESDNGIINAFIAVWTFAAFVYIEHFAVDKESRGKGIGSEIINSVINMCDNRVFLEVEPPETEQARKRIAFYERNMFSLNYYDYIQPALSETTDAIPLMIMTTEGSIVTEEFEYFRKQVYTYVYGKRCS